MSDRQRRTARIPQNNGHVNLTVVFDTLRGELVTALQPEITASEINPRQKNVTRSLFEAIN
jgi:hypothetical protein